VITERGDLVLAAANTNAYEELGRFQAITNFHTDYNKCWNALAVSDGQVYVRSTAAAARFDLSMPELRLDPPQLATHPEATLLIRTATGVPITSNRLAGLEVRTSADATLPPAQWPKPASTLVLSNGVVRATLVDVPLTGLFFIASEPLLSSPRLLLDPPRFSIQTRASLAIRTVTGTPITSNRLADLELRASTNAALPLALWPRLASPLILSNGVVRATGLDASPPQQFFIVTEPQ
jgi:hypothetical protein